MGVAIGFVSLLSQAEALSGNCGFHPAKLHAILVILIIGGLSASISVAMGFEPAGIVSVVGSSLIVGAYILFVYLLEQGGVLLADRVLFDCAIVLALNGSSTTKKFVIGKLMISAAISKFLDTNCDASWFSFSSLKSDALNQPFPFTPVWHLAQLPDHYASILSMLILVCEVVLPLCLMLSTSGSVIENASAISIVAFSTLYYSVIGNFNWSVLVLIALCLSLIHSDVLILLFGEQLFTRWGFRNVEYNEKRAESFFLHVLMASFAILGALWICVGLIVLLLKGDLMNIPTEWSVGNAVSILLIVLTLRSCLASYKESGPKGPLIILAGIVVSGSSFLSMISFSWIPFKNDYSSLPTCYSFSRPDGIEFPVHSKTGRAVFLFQTKYSVIGTNTVGSDLGGTKYAELALPGSVHADEQRPPFLLGHLPRLSLRLWKMGTGDLENIRSGLELVDFLSAIVRDGSNAIRVFFPDADDNVVNSLISSVQKTNKKKNDIRGFYQQYQVTSRAADHQWWKRNYENVAALPALSESKPKNLPPSDCSILVPPKILGYHLDTILITGIIGLLVLRILFINPKKSSATMTTSPQSKSGQKKTN